jgi:uncharacterized membrane protein YhaH (DUF805 family)
MPILEVLFSFKGRISRSEYWLKGFLILLPFYMLNGILSYVGSTVFDTDLANSGAAKWNVAMILSLLLTVLSLWPHLAVIVKRWHDRNRSAWWLLTLLIPIVNWITAIWILIEVWFVKGTDGPNRFGQDPLA